MTHTPAVDSQLLGAVARGWCHPKNAHKVMDPDLAEAIAQEVAALTRPPGGSERLREAWQPIATAARDRKHVLAWFPGNQCSFTVVWLEGEWCHAGVSSDSLGTSYGEPTHWQPLPPAPDAALASPQGAEQRQEGNIAENHPESANVCNRGDTERPADRVDGGDGYGRRAQAGAGIGAHGLGAGVLHNGHAEPSKDRDSAGNLAATHVATPHPEPAATQGDAVAYQSLVEAVHCYNVRADAGDKAAAEYWRAEVNRYAAALSSPPGVQAAQVSDAVNRFLCWKLPKDFAPDAGISFVPTFFQKGENADLHWPVGTNLFTAYQAKAMFEHCLAQPGSAAEPAERDNHVTSTGNGRSATFHVDPSGAVIPADAEPADAGRRQGMLPDALVPHAKEWYRLCERRFAVERMTISGQLAEAIVEAISARPPSEAAAVGDADQRSAFEFAFTTGHLETDCRNFQRPQGGRYVQDRIEALWEGWQKCAALNSQQAVKP